MSEYDDSLVASTEPSNNLAYQEERLASWAEWYGNYPTDSNFLMVRYYLEVIINIRVDRIKLDHCT